MGLISPPAENSQIDPLMQCGELSAAVALQPAAHFDLMVAALQAQSEQSPSAGQDAVLKATDHFRTELARLPAEFRQQAALSRLLEQLDSLKDADHAKGPQAPWKAESPGGGIQAFTLNLGNASLSLQFARVQPRGADATYLCTTELSFAEFAALTSSQPAPLIRQLLVDFSPEADPRPGPRVWDWQDPSLGVKSF